MAFVSGARSGGRLAYSINTATASSMRSTATSGGRLVGTVSKAKPPQRSTVIGFPNYNAPLVDMQTGLLTPIGLRFLQAMWERTGGTGGTT